MLVLARKVGEKIILNDNIEIIVLDLSEYNNCIKLHKMVRNVDILIN